MEDAEKGKNEGGSSFVTSSTKKPLFQLKVKKKRRRRADEETAGRIIAEQFGTEDDKKPSEIVQPARTEPLVIPSEGNKLKWNKKPTTKTVVKQEETSTEDAEAARALQEQASTSSTFDGDNNDHRVIESNNINTFASGNKTTTKDETQQYRDDLEALPDSLSETADAYQKVPIAEFGAALLRGMGWKEDATTREESSAAAALPRPHRLGLGAIPKAGASEDHNNSGTSRRPKRPDQFQRNQAVQLQQETYRKEREQQLALDKQRTLQNGSLVMLGINNKRARILKLVGVPGLNMVSVQYEGDSAPSIIKRSAIERLLTRQELDEKPFQEPQQSNSSRKERKESEAKSRDQRRVKTEEGHEDDRRRSRNRDDEKKRRQGGDSVEKDRSSKNNRKKKQKVERPVWVIPNIRVRIITEKLGRSYYKQKGVVVDVTTAGATLQMHNNAVLEHVPERYLETALPKTGGNAVVLTGEHKFAKGRLLERDSRKGVLQIFEDMSVLTLSLDDMAEWCGPLDDSLG